MSVLFSIVIPTHNRAEQLLMTLTAFDIQTCSRNDYEVIVVDDGSTDHTKELVENMDVSYTLRYTSTGKKSGRSKARNEGIRIVRGKVVIFCDVDFIVAPYFIDVFKKYHNRYPKSIISGIPNSWGRAYVQYYPDFLEWQKEEMYSILSELHLWRDEFWGEESRIVPLLTPEDLRHNFNLIYNYARTEISNQETKELYRQTDVAPWLLFVTRCVSVEKQHLDQVGWFDENFVKYSLEDWELGYRLHLEGISFISMDETVGFHQEHPREEFDERKSCENNLVKFYEKFKFNDPEINLLAEEPAWIYIRRYKTKLRKFRWYEKRGKIRKAEALKNRWRKKAMQFYRRMNEE